MVPVIAFLEAFVGVGLLISGVILLSVCTLLYTQELATLQQMLPLAFVGATLSDHIGYYLGRVIGPKFHQTEFAKKRAKMLKKAEDQVVKYGPIGIIIGRFMTPVRSIVPLLAGVSDMPRLKYTCYDLLACAIWVTGLGLLIVGFDKLWG